uniref:Protein NDRG3 n=1 Tax=Acrobeloides nanus TaxID=290746 RepID=A0A914C6W9_9BILA
MFESEETILTAYGHVLVNVYGNKKKYPIFTFHDIGLNAQDNFNNFFINDTGDLFGTGFCVYNINAPGQELMANEFPTGYRYPTYDELVLMIEEIVKYYDVKSFVGLGVGAGAHLMLRYAVKNPDKVDGLILINCVETKIGWLEWAQEKLNVELLKDFGMTKFTENYLLWHHLGQCLWECPKIELQAFRRYFETRPNTGNVAAFINSYLDRSTIDIQNQEKPFTVPILQIVGDHRSAFVQDARYLHSLLDPKTSELLELFECGSNVLEEKPGKVAEAILFFLQGMGFVSWLNVHDAVKELVKKDEAPIEKKEESKTTDTTNQPTVGDGGFIENILII